MPLFQEAKNFEINGGNFYDVKGSETNTHYTNSFNITGNNNTAIYPNLSRGDNPTQEYGNSHMQENGPYAIGGPYGELYAPPPTTHEQNQMHLLTLAYANLPRCAGVPDVLRNGGLNISDAPQLTNFHGPVALDNIRGSGMSPRAFAARDHRDHDEVSQTTGHHLQGKGTSSISSLENDNTELVEPLSTNQQSPHPSASKGEASEAGDSALSPRETTTATGALVPVVVGAVPAPNRTDPASAQATAVCQPPGLVDVKEVKQKRRMFREPFDLMKTSKAFRLASSWFACL